MRSRGVGEVELDFDQKSILFVERMHPLLWRLEIASARDEVTREREGSGRERETNNEENFKKKHKNENFALLPKRIEGWGRLLGSQCHPARGEDA
jgi:hypothetical protein